MSTKEKTVGRLIEPFIKRPGGLLPALHAIQEHFGYIDKSILPHVAEMFNRTRADVYGVVSFYHDFRSEKPKAHVVKICQAEACQAVGARKVSKAAKTKAAKDVTFEDVYCLGNCACGPAVMVDEKVYGRVDAKRLDQILDDHRKKGS